jgi:hypothetical protein
VNKTVSSKQSALWNTFGLALGAEPRRDHLVVQGASGLDHPVQSLSVDDKGRRLIIVSADPSPRIAALMQADVQAAMPESRVLVARPVVFDLGVLTRRFFPNDEMIDCNISELKQKADNVDANKLLDQAFGSVEKVIANVALPALTQIVDIFQQLACLDWKEIFEGTTEDHARIHLARLRDIDNMAIDRQHGICPVPLYEFQDQDWELFNSGMRVEDARERMKQLGIFQYFFPPADHLVLGAVERGVDKAPDVVAAVNTAPSLGHPFGELELLDGVSDLPALIEQFKALNYLVETDLSYELTPEGRTVRANVRTRPREAFFEKLLNRFSLNANVSLSPKDLFPPGSH